MARKLWQHQETKGGCLAILCALLILILPITTRLFWLGLILLFTFYTLKAIFS